MSVLKILEAWLFKINAFFLELESKSEIVSCDPMHCSPQAPLSMGLKKKKKKRILEWIAISFSQGSSRPRFWSRVSHITGWFLAAGPPGNIKTQIWFFFSGFIQVCLRQKHICYFLIKKERKHIVSVYFEINKVLELQ